MALFALLQCNTSCSGMSKVKGLRSNTFIIALWIEE